MDDIDVQILTTAFLGLFFRPNLPTKFGLLLLGSIPNKPISQIEKLPIYFTHRAIVNTYPIRHRCRLCPKEQNTEELRGPRSFVPRMAQHRCAISSFWSEARMRISERFTPRTPDPDKAPRPPTHHQPPAEKPGKPILVPSKLNATFQWPPDCLWPFTEDGGRDSDA